MYATTINNRDYNEQNEKVKAGLCLFPFKYKRKKHNKCLSTKRGDICATSLSKFGTLKTYGYCPSKKSTAKKTLKLKKKIKLKQIKHKTKVSKRKTSMSKQRQSGKNPSKKLKQISPKQAQSKKQTSLLKTIKMPRFNEEFIALLGELEQLMNRKGEPMRARAYSRAQESLMLILDDITDPKQLKGVPGIGKTIIKKFQEYLETGKLNTLEKAKGNPIYLFARIHGIGPKKAKELVNKDGVTSLEELEQRKDELLNGTQKKGLKYFHDIQKRIPREEIIDFERKFREEFNKVKGSSGQFEIVGSYRRGAKNSGDIDIIVSDDGKDKKLFHRFIDALIAKGIIIDVLSKGRIKSMVVARLPGKPARRVDFMYTPRNEFSFAILYFTGSKAFNVMMREHAKMLGYSLNEHRLSNLKDKTPVLIHFPTEHSIFEFLNMKYKEPAERKDGRAVVVLKAPVAAEEAIIDIKQTPKKNTLKKKRGPSAKKLLKKFQKDGVALLDTLEEPTLEKMIRMANDFYYNKKALLDDNQYDILKEYMERKFPENTVLKEVGAPIDKKKKVKLPYFLASMDKIKPDTKALAKWKASYPGKKVVSAKLDGVSGLVVHKKSKKTGKEKSRMYTRGNGAVGHDITALIPYLNIPIVDDSAVRGELIMLEDVFNKKYSKEYKNARSAVTGIINSDFTAKNADKYKDLNFVAYEVIRPRLKPSEQMKFLEKHHFTTVKYVVLPDITNEQLSDLLVDWRENYEYQNDGLVVSDDKIYIRWKKNPKHAFAFKMVLSDQKAEAKVVDVIWTASKDGLLKPRVRIEPVDIGGATIEYATAFNADFVNKNKIGIGAIVEMVRSGDVIPHILRVITPAAQSKMPDVPYHWTDTHVDIVLDEITGNTGVQEKIVSRFFKQLDVEGLGAGNVKRLMNAGFDTIAKIINMKEEDFLKAEGFKKKLAKKVFTSIHKKLAEASLVEIMAATNLFGRGMGRRRLRAILQTHPSLIKGETNKEEGEKKIAALKGFGDKTAKDFIDKLNKFLAFVKDAHLEDKLKIKKKKMDESHPLYDKEIVMTGFRDKELAKRIVKLSGKPLRGAISKKTFVVLVQDMDEDTGKADDARRLGIQMLTPEQFIKKYLR